MTFYVEGKIHFNGTCFHIVSSVNRPKQVYQKLEYVQHDVKNYYKISFLFSNSYKKNVTNDLYRGLIILTYQITKQIDLLNIN